MKKHHIWEPEIMAHINNLSSIFGWEGDYLERTRMYRGLCRVERRASRDNERVCNGEVDRTDEAQDRYDNRILAEVNRLTSYRDKNIPVFLNGDPRGHALKIESEWVAKQEVSIYRDWGGYGILCPDDLIIR